MDIDMTENQRAMISEFVLDELQRTNGELHVDEVIVNALMRAGVDLRKEPSLEEMKCILLDAVLAARGALAAG